MIGLDWAAVIGRRLTAALVLPLALAVLLALPAQSMAFGFLSSFGNAQLTSPVDVAVDDNAGRILVAGNERIAIFSTQGAFLGSFGSSGTGPGQFTGIDGVAINPANGDIYTTDNHRVQQFTSGGAFIRTWGASGTADGSFNDPAGVSVAGDAVWVADYNNNRVQQFTLTGSFVRKLGKSDATPGTGAGEFDHPYDVAVASNGTIYVADGFNNRIQAFNAAGAFVFTWGSTGSLSGQFSAAYGVAIDAAQNVWVADNSNNRIQQFTPNGTFLARYGRNGGDGSSGSGPGEMYSVYGPAIDCRGNVFVADNNNARISKWGEPGAGDPPCPKPPPAAQPPPPAIDKTAPTQSLKYRKRQRLKKLAITVKVTEASVLEGAGSVNVPGASKRLKFRTVKRNVAANSSTKLAMKLSKRNYRRALRALRRKRLTARLTVKATDAARNTATAKAAIKLKR
jgi:hypothetical protein